MALFYRHTFDQLKLETSTEKFRVRNWSVSIVPCEPTRSLYIRYEPNNELPTWICARIGNAKFLCISCVARRVFVFYRSKQRLLSTPAAQKAKSAADDHRLPPGAHLLGGCRSSPYAAATPVHVRVCAGARWAGETDAPSVRTRATDTRCQSRHRELSDARQCPAGELTISRVFPSQCQRAFVTSMCFWASNVLALKGLIYWLLKRCDFINLLADCWMG